MLIREAIINNSKDVSKLLQTTGCSIQAHNILIRKGINKVVIIEKIDNRAVNILKQEAISVGADIAINKNVSKFILGFSNAVLFSDLSRMLKLIDKLSVQPFNLKNVAMKIKDLVFNKKNKIFKFRNKHLNLNKPIIMGIINLDPNSFSGDGLVDPYKALNKAIEFEKLGASIIDIGAESSRPGSLRLDIKTEINRLLPVIKLIKKNIKIPLSIDTYKYETAKIVLNEGVDIINDIFALRKGKDKLAKLIAHTKAGLIIMHMQGEPNNMQKLPQYKNCISEIYEFLDDRKTYAMNFNIKSDFIAVDPGPGFGKNIAHNMELLKNFKIFSSLGVVVGAISRKSFISKVFGQEKISIDIANFLALFYGSDILRVHNVKNAMLILKIFNTLNEKNEQIT
ncbi:MAG: dihydropteroate synthase [Endomicrobium sp.]|jgi:dihydropteroate synthase|nr:dihydropteroate synthase [Endomicrobium sp.]